MGWKEQFHGEWSHLRSVPEVKHTNARATELVAIGAGEMVCYRLDKLLWHAQHVHVH